MEQNSRPIRFLHGDSADMQMDLMLRTRPGLLIFLSLLLIGLASCAPIAQPAQKTSTPAPVPVSTPTRVLPEPTQKVANTQPPGTQGVPTKQAENQNATPITVPTEARLVELEWLS